MLKQKTRGFEVARGWEKDELNLPKRMTENAAGYDFEASAEVVIPSIWKVAFQAMGYFFSTPSTKDQRARWHDLMKPTLVPTGIKAYMQEDEALYLYNRSSNPLKKLLLLSNGVGVVDSDYYNSEESDGHIMFQFINLGLWSVRIKKGERIGQGVFQQFLLADGDKPGGKRKGGHGHTNVE